MKTSFAFIRQYFYTKKKIILISLSLGVSALINWKIYQQQYSNIFPLLWSVSLVLPLLAYWELGGKALKTFFFSRSAISYLLPLLLAIVLLPTTIRILNYDLDRIHGDELITAYFSAHYNFAKDNFFAPIPTNKDEWVCQFPSLFFVLQKLSFLILGENLLAVKISVIPYVLLVSLMLFLTAKKILNWEVGAIATILYSFLAISLYHETLGLHFISSTAFFMLFFYFLLLEVKQTSLLNAWLSGVFCGFCYLSYTSSYVALPMLFLALFLRLFRSRKIDILKNFLISLAGFLLVISPFLTYMVKTKNFYFIGRINQVSLLWGTWSSASKVIIQGGRPFTIIVQNFLIAIKSFYTNNLGGHGGYNFGHLALFDYLTLVFFVLGLIMAVFWALKRTEFCLIVLFLLISFISGVALTIPPPPYHRLSATFPFLALIISLPFTLLLGLPKKVKNSLGVFFMLIFLSSLCLSNYNHFSQALKKDGENYSLKLAKYLTVNFPDRNIYIASFPNFALEKIIYFVQGGRNKSILGTSIQEKDSTSKTTPSSPQIRTDYHYIFLHDFDPKEKYLYVILFPETFKEKFKNLDPNGKMINFSQEYSLFMN